MHEDQDRSPYLGGRREILARVCQMRAQGWPFSLPAREGALRRLQNVEIKPRPGAESLVPWTVIYKSLIYKLSFGPRKGTCYQA